MPLFTAIPVSNGGRMVGAVHVSQSTNRIFRALDQMRLGVFQVCLASVAVAAVLCLLVSTTFVRPLRRLRDEARAILDRRGGSRATSEARPARRDRRAVPSPPGAEPSASRSTARFTESFAADLATS